MNLFHSVSFAVYFKLLANNSIIFGLDFFIVVGTDTRGNLDCLRCFLGKLRRLVGCKGEVIENVMVNIF